MMTNHKPYIYTSFVSTIDGKIFVQKDGYWPIGSAEDYSRFTALRAKADVIIDGKGTALKFAARTIETIHSPHFQKLRQQEGKEKKVQYIILTTQIDDELLTVLKNTFDYKPMIMTTSTAKIPSGTEEIASVITVDADESGKVNLHKAIEYIAQNSGKTIFIDGGSQLIASCLAENLIEDMFLTIAPKIYGNDGTAQTMVEGILFPPDKVPQFRLLSVDKIGEELFIHYRISK